MYHLERYNSIAYWKIAGETGDYKGGKRPWHVTAGKSSVKWQLLRAADQWMQVFASACSSPRLENVSCILSSCLVLWMALDFTLCAWFCVCFQGIQRAYSGTLLNQGGMCSAEQQAHEATHHFSVLSIENNNLFCAHWAQLYIIRVQKLFGCFRAAGCLHRWRTGYGDCGLSAAGDFCGLWSEANSSWESQNACNSSTVCHQRRFLRGKREGQLNSSPAFRHAFSHTYRNSHTVHVYKIKCGSLSRMKLLTGQHEALNVLTAWWETR